MGPYNSATGLEDSQLLVSTSNYILQLVMCTESEVGTELLVRTGSEKELELPTKISTHLCIIYSLPTFCCTWRTGDPRTRLILPVP